MNQSIIQGRMAFFTTTVRTVKEPIIENYINLRAKVLSGELNVVNKIKKDITQTNIRR